MNDWTAEDIARAIERRRGRGRRGGISRSSDPEANIRDWSEADWAAAFERRHGLKAVPRGIVKVRIPCIEGETAILDVHEFRLTGQAIPWFGFAWIEGPPEKPRFGSAVNSETIVTAYDAVTTVGRF
jgi:hypothetical protein